MQVTALQRAAARGRTDVVRTLVLCGADVNMQPSALHAAIEAGHLATARYLHDEAKARTLHMAGVTLLETALMAAIHRSVDRPVDPFIRTLRWAIDVTGQHGGTVAAPLNNVLRSVEPPVSPLRYACFCGDTDVVGALLLAGANPNDVASNATQQLPDTVSRSGNGRGDRSDERSRSRSAHTPPPDDDEAAASCRGLCVAHLTTSSLLAIAVRHWDRTMLRLLIDAGARLVPQRGQESALMA